MDNHQKTELKEKIAERIQEAEKNIGAYRQLIKPIAPDSAIGRISRMEAINSKSINEAALKRAMDTLSQLETALTLIDRPDFGLCSGCEEPIPFARLMIMPQAKLCVQCVEDMSE
ncbi:MAG: TraR/DksA C4-type zinc finger protein [Desulfobacteraceae bacterium]